MSNEFYNSSNVPQQGAPGSSTVVRSEFQAISQAFDKMPQLSGYGGYLIRVDNAGNKLETVDVRLGTIAVQDENDVDITGGRIQNIQDLAVADGGTGASTASQARTNLGLSIGVNVQAYSAMLTKFAGLTGPADRMIYFSAEDTPSLTAMTAYGRSLVAMVDAAALLANLSLTNVAKLDVAQTFTKPQTADVLALVDLTAWDASDKQHLTANVNGGIFTVANPTDIQPNTYYALYVTYATAHGLAFDSAFRGVSGVAATASVGAHDHFIFRANSAGTQLELVAAAYNVGAA